MQEQNTTKISASSVKLGNILFYRNELCIVSKNPEHVKPGKGPAYMQIELKSLKRGTKYNERFSSSEYVEKAFLDSRQLQYSYWDGNDIIFIDLKSYDEVRVASAIVGEQRAFFDHVISDLNDNIVVTADLYGDEVVNVHLPQTLVVQVVDTAPSIKGSTASPSYKQATLSNELKTTVPPYIENDDKIVIKTEDRSFMERAK